MFVPNPKTPMTELAASHESSPLGEEHPITSPQGEMCVVKTARPMSQNGMDRPCSRQTREHASGAIRRRNHAMPRTFDTAVDTIGIDPGTNTLHLVL